MKPYDILTIVTQNVRRSRLRSMVSLVFMLIGVALIATTYGISNGIESVNRENILSSGSLLKIDLHATPQSPAFTPQQLTAIHSLPHAKSTFPVFSYSTGVEYAGQKIGAIVLQGIPQQNWLSSAKLPTQADTNHSIVVPQMLDGVQTRSWIGHTVTIDYPEYVQGVGKMGQLNLKVAGTYDISQTNNIPNSAYVSPDTAIYLLSRQKDVPAATYSQQYPPDTVSVIADNVDNVEALGRHFEAQGYDAVYILKELHQLPGSVMLIDLLGAVMALLSLIGAIVTIGLNTAQTVRSRTREIALMKAIGYSNRDVFMLLFSEVAVIGLVGAACGLVLSYLLRNLLSSYLIEKLQVDNFRFDLPLSLLVACLLGSLALSLLSGVLPLTRAVKLHPSIALKSEE